MLSYWMVSERETVVGLPWAADSCPCVHEVEAAYRVASNCWYQRRCGAVGVRLRWRRQLSKSMGSFASLCRHCLCLFHVDSWACVLWFGGSAAGDARGRRQRAQPVHLPCAGVPSRASPPRLSLPAVRPHHTWGPRVYSCCCLCVSRGVQRWEKLRS
jgi:hypothetical protein